MQKKISKIILIDMDGVLADYESGFLNAFKAKFPNHPHIPLEDRKAFYVRDDYPEALKEDVGSIYTAQGFFLSLPIISGAKKALQDMLDLGNDVYICTSPLFRYEDCVLEKYDWVAKHLGYDWTKRMIVTRDKTLIYGDILIDDKPAHTGLRTPSWEHVLYDAPYNQDVADKRRLTWSNWQGIVTK